MSTEINFMDKKTIGHWYANDSVNKDYPKPVENSATLAQVMAQIEEIEKLTKRAPERSYRGWSTCRICRQRNGTRAYVTERGEMPEGLRHYVEAHHVLVPGLLPQGGPETNEEDWLV